MPAHEDPRVGYAVVGLGWISQVAMLPAFANAARNSRLTALVSGDPVKRAALADRYGLPASATYDYDDLEACLERDDVDAVYIAVPNHLHREYTVRAAAKGVHVLCEKPMAVTEEECGEMIRACAEHGVKLMIAYRLHLEPANLDVVRRVLRGDIGDTRFLAATFGLQIDDDDIRLAPPEQGGGPLYDIGIYCINAARYLFRAEPRRVLAATATRPEARFANVEEMFTGVLEFPGDRHATFTASFGAADVSDFQLVGTTGTLEMTNAFSFRGAHGLRVTRDGEEVERTTWPETDHFGPQLLHFSGCIAHDREPGPNGEEGLVDVRIIRALYESLERGGLVDVDVRRDRRPEPDQAVECPAFEPPELVHASEPSE